MHACMHAQAELAQQLMYSDLDLLEDGVDLEAGEGIDYSVLSWCLAQMVWVGRADWAGGCAHTRLRPVGGGRGSGG